MSVGQSKKFRAPMENWTSNLPISALRCFTMSHRDSTVSESSLWHASCRRLVSRRLVNTHFIIVFVLVHLLSISLSLVNNYYTISLLSLINVPCKYTCKDFTTVIATKSSLLNRRCSIIATGYLLPLRARPFVRGPNSTNPRIIKIQVPQFLCSRALFRSFSLFFLEHSIIKLDTKWIKLNFLLKVSDLRSNFTLTLGYLNPALNNLALINNGQDLNILRGLLWALKLGLFLLKCWLNITKSELSQEEKLWTLTQGISLDNLRAHNWLN